ncbi:hypothetical protein MLD38_040904 [Melastoma candidum]|nr:hypothetical protein MLD38_040904 [Melastoma candidum]
MALCLWFSTLMTVAFFFFFFFFVRHCDGSTSSTTNVLWPPQPDDNPQGIGHFLEYLPRGIPIPYSGPSRKHNDIGLQSSSTSP